jgi:hypothetical protein
LKIEWVPSHVGIGGNEKADRLAEEACKSNIILEIPHDATILQKLGHIHYKKEWQEEWEQTTWGLGIIKPELGDSIPKELKRKGQIIITRLRMGVCKFTHRLFFEQTEREMCNHCHAPITIQHLLIDCEKFREQQAIM